MPNTTLNYKTYRSNPINSRNGRPTSGHCIECGRVTSIADGGKRVTIPSQKNGVWMCAAHRGKKNLNDYCDENHMRVGKGNADNITISVELESMGRSTSARAYLVKNHFLPTHDSTVDIEYKSPIYTSELPLAKIVGGIEYMNNNNNYDFDVNNENCGIHTHFGFSDNHFNFTDLYEHYYDLFMPLNKVIDEIGREKRIEIFGRDFEHYNRKLDNYYVADRHENWINIQHCYTLEIRMPRFVSAKQYMRFLKTFKKIFKTLNTYYIERAHTETNAKKCAEKMVKVFKKEYSEYFEDNNSRNIRFTDGTTDSITIDTTAYSTLINAVNYPVYTYIERSA